MNKVVYLVSLMLLAGCESSRISRSTTSDGKDGFHAQLNQKPFFSLVTDGKVSGGVSVYGFIGPVSAIFKGTIRNSNETETISFTASGSKILIGQQEYNFENGRLILVSTKAHSFKVSQYKVTEKEKINSLIASDSRMVDFFEKNR